MTNLMADSLVLGGFGGLIYLYMTYCLYKILKHIRADEDTALTKMFIDQEARHAFKILALSTFSIAVLFTARIVLGIAKMQTEPSYIIMVMPIPLTGIAYFFHKLKLITRKNKQ